jgi:hypothetical protein
MKSTRDLPAIQTWGEYQGMVEDSVKAARSASRLLVLCCCIAIVLAFSPEEQNINKAAINEINSLLNTDVGSLLLEGAQENKEVLNTIAKGRAIASRQGLRFSVSGESGEIVYVEPRPIAYNSSSLEDIERFFLNLNKLTVTYLQIDPEFEKELREFLTENYKAKWGRDVQLTVNQNLQEPFFNLNFGNLSTRAKLSHKLKVNTVTLSFDMMRSLRNSDKHHRLFAGTGEESVFLPGLRQVWEQVRTENPINARSILARKDIPQERRVAAFGLSVPEQLVTWAMPGLILAFSIHLLVYVLHLHRLSKMTHKLINYPWVGVLPGYLASVVSVALHFVLPVGAILSVFLTRTAGQGGPVRVVLLAAVAVTILVLAVVNVALHHVRISAARTVRIENNASDENKQKGGQ